MNQKPVTAMSIKMIVKITSYDNGLSGMLDSIYFKEPLTFISFVDMIEMMETTFDALGFPDKALLPRTFGKAKERMRRHEMDLEKLLAARQPGGAAAEMPKDAPLATFEIFVGFRHNAEWQGRLRWADKDVTKTFSSIVEMARHMDDALAGDNK